MTDPATVLRQIADAIQPGHVIINDLDIGQIARDALPSPTRTDWVTDMAAWAKRVPLSTGQMPNGSVREAFGVNNMVMLLIDDNGRVHQVEGGTISDGMIRSVSDGRTATIALLDHFNVQDWAPPTTGATDQ